MIRKKINLFCLFLLSALVACGPQSRKLSRFTGKPVELKLPKDCVQVISVSIAQDSGAADNQIKNLTYINDKGDLITKEFSDWGFLEGSIKWVRHDGSSYAKKRSTK
jgi:hypothetical protein